MGAYNSTRIAESLNSAFQSAILDIINFLSLPKLWLWRNLQLGELNGANPPRIDNTKALWISLSVTRRGHGAVAREYFE